MTLPNARDMRSIASKDLATLAHDALAELDYRTKAEQWDRWNELVHNIQAYINDFGSITIEFNGETTDLTLNSNFSFENVIITETEDK